MFKINSELLKNWTVLVIDDEPDSLMLAQMLLERCGATVLTAVNGKEGFDIIANNRPRFVLSDLSMPILDGWGMNELVQQDPNLRTIPIIAFTAHAMIKDRERAIAAGFHNYITKPLTPRTFIQNLLKLLLDVPELHDHLASALEEDN
ncbi:MAG TPA: response regulator [Aggregatilineales bacterium]|nr:response regulator [Aggregatilineales bacterium]